MPAGEAAKGFDDVRLTPTTFLIDKRGAGRPEVPR
jgi:hypothetical protein